MGASLYADVVEHLIDSVSTVDLWRCDLHITIDGQCSNDNGHIHRNWLTSLLQADCEDWEGTFIVQVTHTLGS